MIFPSFTGKHTQTTTENSKGMKNVGTSNVSHVSREPLQCIDATTQTQVMLSKSLSETTAIPMVCTLMEHGFFPVLSIVGKW